ncbi:unnamed protein product [Closterium sp. Yama58-4]|nr:unnamed protein product [Closterium sp. Yama58-4]
MLSRFADVALALGSASEALARLHAAPSLALSQGQGQGEGQGEGQGQAQALGQIRGSEFHLVLVNLRLADMSGFAFTQAVRRIEEQRYNEDVVRMGSAAQHSHIPIVGLVNDALPELVAKWKEAGMDGMLSNPIDEAQLLTVAQGRGSRRAKAEDDAVEEKSDVKREKENGVVNGKGGGKRLKESTAVEENGVVKCVTENGEVGEKGSGKRSKEAGATEEKSRTKRAKVNNGRSVSRVEAPRQPKAEKGGKKKPPLHPKEEKEASGKPSGQLKGTEKEAKKAPGKARKRGKAPAIDDDMIQVKQAPLADSANRLYPVSTRISSHGSLPSHHCIATLSSLAQTASVLRPICAEEVAIVLTHPSDPAAAAAAAAAEKGPVRQLLDFVFHDSEGALVPLDSFDALAARGEGLFATGVILPETAALRHMAGYRCEAFGPIDGWYIDGYEKANTAARIMITTDAATYVCCRPAAKQKKDFTSLQDKANLCVEVYRALSKPDGGDPTISLPEVVARVSRALGRPCRDDLVVRASIASHVPSTPTSPRSKQDKANLCVEVYRALSKPDGGDPTISLPEVVARVSRALGRPCRDELVAAHAFVLQQLCGLDKDADEDDQLFSGLPALESLKEEGAKHAAVRSIVEARQASAKEHTGKKPAATNGALVIRDTAGGSGSSSRAGGGTAASSNWVLDEDQLRFMPLQLLLMLPMLPPLLVSADPCLPLSPFSPVYSVCRYCTRRPAMPLSGRLGSLRGPAALRAAPAAAHAAHVAPCSVATLLTAVPSSPLCPPHRCALLTAVPSSPLCPPYRCALLTAVPSSPLCPPHRCALLTAVPSSSLPLPPPSVDEETDEFLLFDDAAAPLHPDDLPRRRLDDWALYDDQLRFVPLELLPMLPGVAADSLVFGSGVMMEDDGSGFSLDDPTVESAGTTRGDGGGAGGSSGGAGASGSGSGASGSGSGSGSDPAAADGGGGGIRVYLSAIKEWMIEFGAGMLFVTIRTDGAWYRLGRPCAAYVPWYRPVLRTARLAIRVIEMLSGESRAARLSFLDVVTKLAQERVAEKQQKSGKAPARGDLAKCFAEMERFLVVHGNIILQQFREYPVETIRRSPFISTLREKMETRSHTELKVSKKKAAMIVANRGSNGRGGGDGGSARNANPAAALRPDASKRKPMRATTTQLVHRIWKEYYERFGLKRDECAEADKEAGVTDKGKAAAGGTETEKAKEAAAGGSKAGGNKAKAVKDSTQGVTWIGTSTGRTEEDHPAYASASVWGLEVRAGIVVLAAVAEGEHDEHEGRWREEEEKLVLVDELASVTHRKQPWGAEHRLRNMEEHERERERMAKLFNETGQRSFFYRLLYNPSRGGFFDLPKSLGSGTGRCCSCDEDAERDRMMEVRRLGGGKAGEEEKVEEGFAYLGKEFRVQDFVFLHPAAVGEESEGKKVKIAKGGRNIGLRAWPIGQIERFVAPTGGAKEVPEKMVVRRFFRPEDVPNEGDEIAYTAHIREVYYSETLITVDVTDVIGKCRVQRGKPTAAAAAAGAEADHLGFNIGGCLEEELMGGDFVFFCDRLLKDGSVRMLPPGIRFGPSSAASASPVKEKGKGKGKSVATDDDADAEAAEAAAAARARAKGKGKAAAEEPEEPTSKAATGAKQQRGKQRDLENQENAENQEEGQQGLGKSSKGGAGVLRTLDIFAGCGGLSEGLQRSGACETQWAIEYEHPAAEAFQKNHPDAAVICANCNVVLSAGGRVCCCAEAFQLQRCAQGSSTREKLPTMWCTSAAALPTMSDGAQAGLCGAQVGVMWCSVLLVGGCAAEAFQKNKPDAAVWILLLRILKSKIHAAVICANCNVMLRSMMEQAGQLGDCMSTPEADEAAAKTAKRDRKAAFPHPSSHSPFRHPPCPLLRSMMEQAGQLGDCVSTPEADEAAAKMAEAEKGKLPLPGQVDFVNGGPPCQGFSGMNRFNQNPWSKVQCEMILAFLSFADFLRPNYFLLENVRNFVSFNGARTFRLALRTLLAMGYQAKPSLQLGSLEILYFPFRIPRPLSRSASGSCKHLQAGNFGISQSRTRAFIWAAAPIHVLPQCYLESQIPPTPPPILQVRFGVLQAGNFGISQSRTRAFIWAAAPGHVLPEWPQPLHVFASSQLSVPLTTSAAAAAGAAVGQFSTASSLANEACPRGPAMGAPLRSITVRDAMGDLPSIENGAEEEEMEYSSEPSSWFQRCIRSQQARLLDHTCKKMNELNLKRCQHIPRRPGADWRDLPDIKVPLPDGREADLVPWCLPNTMQRHNNWKGLFEPLVPAKNHGLFSQPQTYFLPFLCHQVRLSDGREADLVPWCLPNTMQRHNNWKGLFGRLDWAGNCFSYSQPAVPASFLPFLPQVRLSDGREADLVPWCLPNTMQRHNNWKGLFGRLDWAGNFPTSVTDPQPMGKVGMCFHPEQDRIVSVRECARSQGFPDWYRFAGNIQAKHRQIGNAVPPPLALALGLQLRKALLETRKMDGAEEEGKSNV